jgi:hypothetical protein
MGVPRSSKPPALPEDAYSPNDPNFGGKQGKIWIVFSSLLSIISQKTSWHICYALKMIDRYLGLRYTLVRVQ